MIKILKLLRYYFLKKILGTSRDIPIYIFSYHKCGTKLLGKIFNNLCLKYGWEYKSFPGYANEIPKSDVVFFLHSQIDKNKLPKKYIGIHVVRDPRDIIISGFLYHKRTDEEWCVNKNFQINRKIIYPQVPSSQMFRSENWKRNYIKGLRGKSYQENINSLSEEKGIFFEMKHYGKWTIEDMLNWDSKTMNCLEIKFEDIMSNYESEMDKIFDHCNLSKSQLLTAKRISENENIKKMSKSAIEKNPHIFSSNTRKWKKYFNNEIKSYFEKNFSEVISKYNY